MTMNRAKCPSCRQTLGRAIMDPLTIDDQQGSAQHRGVSYLCPNCFALLGVGMDPIAQKADIVEEVLAALREAASS